MKITAHTQVLPVALPALACRGHDSAIRKRHWRRPHLQERRLAAGAPQHSSRAQLHLHFMHVLKPEKYDDPSHFSNAHRSQAITTTPSPSPSPRLRFNQKNPRLQMLDVFVSCAECGHTPSLHFLAHLHHRCHPRCLRTLSRVWSVGTKITRSASCT